MQTCTHNYVAVSLRYHNSSRWPHKRTTQFAHTHVIFFDNLRQLNRVNQGPGSVSRVLNEVEAVLKLHTNLETPAHGRLFFGRTVENTQKRGNC